MPKDLPMTTHGLVVVRMPQDTTFHLALPARVGDYFDTVTLCARIIDGAVVVDPREVTNVPVYRRGVTNHVFVKCPSCDRTAKCL